MSVAIKTKDLSYEEQKKIYKLLTFTPTGFKNFNNGFSFSPNYAIQESKVQMFYTKEGIVYLPFWFAAMYYGRIFNQNNIYPKLFTNRKDKFCGSLLPRQVEPFKQALEYIKKYSTVTIALYPGFGKTFLGVMLSWYLNLKVCVLVHRDNVAKSWIKTFKTYFRETIKVPDIKGSTVKYLSSLENGEDDITQVDEKGDYNKNAKVLVVMDTRVKKLDKETIDSVGTLIIDEAHLFCSKSRVVPMLSFKPKYIIAESATINKDNGMHKMIQSICGPHNIEQISDKAYDFYLFETNLDYELEQSNNIFNNLLNAQSYNETRNKLIVDILKANKDYKAIIVNKFKDHCSLLKTMLEKEGMESSELYGNKKNYVPKNILIGTGSKMGVGFDEANFCDDFDGRPSDLILITHSFKSWAPFEQIRGRGMRAEKPNVVMFNDNHNITKKHFRSIKKWVKKTNGVLHIIKVEEIENFKLENLRKF